MTPFNDGFVEYYIIEQPVLSREELETILSKKEQELVPVTKYAKYAFGDFDGLISKEEYIGLKESGDLYRDNGFDYAPIFNGFVYPIVGVVGRHCNRKGCPALHKMHSPAA